MRRVLGSKCENCGSKKDLQFDLIEPTDLPDPNRPSKSKHHRAMGWCDRMRFYCNQFAAGNVGLLCGDCNNIKNGSGGESFYPAARLAVRTPEFNAIATWIRKARKEWPNTEDEETTELDLPAMHRKASKRLANRERWRRRAS